MYCPACGKAIADGSAFCMYCGKPTGVSEQPLDVSVVAVPSASAPICPSCGQMDVVGRVTGVVAQGVTLTRGSTSSTGAGLGLAGTSGTAGHALGASGHVWSGASQSQGLGVSALALLLTNLTKSSKEISAYNLSLMPPDTMVNLNGAWPEKPLPSARWRAEYTFRNNLLSREIDSKIDKFYYCTRCAVVFMLGEREFAPFNNPDPLIYQYPKYVGREFCEVESVGGWLDARSHNYMYGLFAVAYGAKGVYIAHEAYWEGVQLFARRSWTKDYKGCKILVPKEDTPLDLGNYQKMVRDLEAQGWVQLPEHGPDWWQTRFTSSGPLQQV